MYTLGTLLSMQIPFIGFQPIQSSEHLAAFGVFGCLQLYAFNLYARSKLSSHAYHVLFRSILVFIVSLLFSVVLFLTLVGSKFSFIRFEIFVYNNCFSRNFTMDWTFLFAFGSFVCQKLYTNHRFCERTSAHRLVVVLL